MRGSARESEREILRTGKWIESEDRQADREFCETPSDESGSSELPPSSSALLYVDNLGQVDGQAVL